MIDKAAKSGQNYFANKAQPGWLSTLTYGRMTRQYFKYSDRTTRDVIMEIFNDEEILGVLSGQWGDYGLPYVIQGRKEGTNKGGIILYDIEDIEKSLKKKGDK